MKIEMKILIGTHILLICCLFDSFYPTDATQESCAPIEKRLFYPIPNTPALQHPSTPAPLIPTPFQTLFPTVP